jgi:hypothetical protein
MATSTLSAPTGIQEGDFRVIEGSTWLPKNQIKKK